MSATAEDNTGVVHDPEKETNILLTSPVPSEEPDPDKTVTESDSSNAEEQQRSEADEVDNDNENKQLEELEEKFLTFRYKKRSEMTPEELSIVRERDRLNQRRRRARWKEEQWKMAREAAKMRSLRNKRVRSEMSPEELSKLREKERIAQQTRRDRLRKIKDDTNQAASFLYPVLESPVKNEKVSYMKALGLAHYDDDDDYENLKKNDQLHIRPDLMCSNCHGVLKDDFTCSQCSEPDDTIISKKSKPKKKGSCRSTENGKISSSRRQSNISMYKLKKANRHDLSTEELEKLREKERLAKRRQRARQRQKLVTELGNGDILVDTPYADESSDDKTYTHESNSSVSSSQAELLAEAQSSPTETSSGRKDVFHLPAESINKVPDLPTMVPTAQPHAEVNKCSQMTVLPPNMTTGSDDKESKVTDKLHTDESPAVITEKLPDEDLTSGEFNDKNETMTDQSEYSRESDHSELESAADKQHKKSLRVYDRSKLSEEDLEALRKKEREYQRRRRARMREEKSRVLSVRTEAQLTAPIENEKLVHRKETEDLSPLLKKGPPVDHSAAKPSGYYKEGIELTNDSTKQDNFLKYHKNGHVVSHKDINEFQKGNDTSTPFVTEYSAQYSEPQYCHNRHTTDARHSSPPPLKTNVHDYDVYRRHQPNHVKAASPPLKPSPRHFHHDHDRRFFVDDEHHEFRHYVGGHHEYHYYDIDYGHPHVFKDINYYPYEYDCKGSKAKYGMDWRYRDGISDPEWKGLENGSKSDWKIPETFNEIRWKHKDSIIELDWKSRYNKNDKTHKNMDTDHDKMDDKGAALDMNDNSCEGKADRVSPSLSVSSSLNSSISSGNDQKEDNKDGLPGSKTDENMSDTENCDSLPDLELSKDSKRNWKNWKNGLTWKQLQKRRESNREAQRRRRLRLKMMSLGGHKPYDIPVDEFSYKRNPSQAKASMMGDAIKHFNVPRSRLDDMLERRQKVFIEAQLKKSENMCGNVELGNVSVHERHACDSNSSSLPNSHVSAAVNKTRGCRIKVTPQRMVEVPRMSYVLEPSEHRPLVHDGWVHKERGVYQREHHEQLIKKARLPEHCEQLFPKDPSSKGHYNASSAILEESDKALRSYLTNRLSPDTNLYRLAEDRQETSSTEDFKRQAFEEDDQSALNSSRKRKQCKPRRVMADANQPSSRPVPAQDI